MPKENFHSNVSTIRLPTLCLYQLNPSLKLLIGASVKGVFSYWQMAHFDAFVPLATYGCHILQTLLTN